MIDTPYLRSYASRNQAHHRSSRSICLRYDGVTHNVRYTSLITDSGWTVLGCWQSDGYVSKYNMPTTNCATATNDASIFYTNTNAIADYDNRLRHILSHKYTDGTPWSQLSVSTGSGNAYSCSKLIYRHV